MRCDIFLWNALKGLISFLSEWLISKIRGRNSLRMQRTAIIERRVDEMELAQLSIPLE